ncbi:glycosyltransferase [Lysobacter sp. CA196]|uniref:glycosyltransferase n=1 Tax=Lysobacter sp. CA196 TaxID=3455606 RepID=UPI003F8D5FAA
MTSQAASASGMRTALLYLPQLKVGGAEISLLRLAQGLRTRGMEVALVVHRGDAEARALAGDIEVVSLDADRTLSAAGRLVQVLRRRRPEVLVSALTHSNIVAAVAARWAGGATRAVLTEHAPVSSMQRLDPSARYRATLRLMPWAYRLADAVVAVSQGVRDDFEPRLAEATRARLEVIPNPVLRRDWNSLAHEPVDDPWFGADAAPLVLSVGRLSPEKNFAGLIRAFVGVRMPMQTRLAIIGEGPERPALQGLIDELGLGQRVRLLGQRANPYAYMRRARVFVLASLFEGFGNVLIEAMACGIPVISSDCPVGPREILGDGRYGDLVAVGDVSAMTSAIESRLQRPGDQAEATRRALEFTVERSVDEYLALFARIASARSA